MDLSKILDTINHYVEYFTSYLLCFKNNHYYQHLDNDDIENNFPMQMER
jgi:hypothetical protein